MLSITIYLDYNLNMNEQIECNKCGWCCQRSACPLGIYLGASIHGECKFLVKEEEYQYLCGLITRETSEIKKIAAEELIMAQKGCSHKFGPHPVSLLVELLNRGLKIDSIGWKMIKQETRKELLNFSQNKIDPESILIALGQFDRYCEQLENKNSQSRTI